MKDLDFDELDRAVGAALNRDTAKNKTSATKSTPKATTVNSSSQSNSSSTAASSKIATSKSPAMRRSGGRFLDMVHPSADMKKTTNPPIKRAGNKLEPLSKDVQPEDSATSKDEIADKEPTTATPTVDTGIESNPDDVTADSAKTEQQWPDPVDANQPGEQQSDTDVKADNQEPKANLALDEPAKTVDTPFLNDKKPDKRPLGAFAETSSLSAANETDPAGEATASSKDKANKDSDDFEPMPPELKPEALQAEEIDLPDESYEDSSAKVESETETKTTITEDKDKPKDEKSANQPKEAAKPDNTNIAQQSIAQQYKAEPTDNDSLSTGSVFDTNEYHQPMQTAKTPSKLKQTLAVVVLIILLIAIGVAIGYAYYIYSTNGF